MIRIPSLSETVAALSYALDLTEGAVPGHAVRTCLLALRIAERMGMPECFLGSLYYAALLKDVGCSSNAARMCQLVGGDDRAVKSGAKLADWTQPWKPDRATLQMLWAEVLPGRAGWRKATRIAKLGLTQLKNNRELIEIRCDRGASIVRQIGLPEDVAQAVCHLDEHWNGGGYPGGLEKEAIPLLSRLLGVAQHLDAFRTGRGTGEAITTLLERRGSWFDPLIVKHTVALDRAGELWQGCTDDRAAHAAITHAPQPGDLLVEAHSPEQQLDRVCDAFARVVDAKSPYTFRHSVGVRDAAVGIATSLGFSPEQTRFISRAALLHDLGKLSIPNTILDKQGKLTDTEFDIVKQHSAVTRQILNRIDAFTEIAAVAGNHHERTDGSGYPFGLGSDQLNLESRLLAVADVYAALSEDRPYRAGLSFQEIMKTMTPLVPGQLDPLCFEALQAQHSPRVSSADGLEQPGLVLHPSPARQSGFGGIPPALLDSKVAHGSDSGRATGQRP